MAGKSATVEICYNGDDYWFRCPSCDSLNINGEETAEKCPDCGAEFSVPNIATSPATSTTGAVIWSGVRSAVVNY